MILRTRHPWAVKVHAEMLKSGERLTSPEIEERFGRPAGTTSVALRMGNAVKGGWFTTKPASPGSRFHRYVAVRRNEHTAPPKREWVPPVNLDFIGRDFPRVSSVFELARYL